MIRRFELFLLAGLLVVVALFSFNWALKSAIHHQKDVLVPELVGMSVMDALDILSQQNLGLKKEGSEHNDTVPAGTILRQNPAAGLSVREGKIIRVSVSQGGENVYVPDLTGQSIRSAEISLRTRFLTLGEVRSQPSVKYEKDSVMTQDPAPNTIVQKNALVHLTISIGEPVDGTTLIPDFVGKSWSDVQSWAKETAVRVEMTEDPTSPSDPDMVLNQDSPPDSPAPKDRPVKFVISSSKKSGTSKPAGTSARNFKYEVPQGEIPKQYAFVLLDGAGHKTEIFRGSMDPGSKKNIPLPAGTVFPSRVRIFVNGILTEEKTLQ